MIRVTSHKPGERRAYDEKYHPHDRLTREVSTYWLGTENPGMNVAIYVPEYHSREGTMLMCVYPGGRFEMEWSESWLRPGAREE